MTKKIKPAIGRWLCIIILLFLGANMHAVPDSNSDTLFKETHTEQLPPAPSTGSSLLLEDILFYSSIIVAYLVFDWYRSRKKVTDITY